MSKVLLVVFEKEIFRKIFPSLGPMLKICFLFKRAMIKLKLVFITNQSIFFKWLHGFREGDILKTFSHKQY